MKTVAVIAEYNPFHEGHAYHLKKIREEFGSDCRIFILMSGNYTQRGEVAFAEKTLRAQWAVLGGADLVLEIPFPYSVCAAPDYARAGVFLASVCGADVLSFGTECGELSLPERVADAQESDAFRELFAILKKRNRELGYPALSELVLRRMGISLPDGFFSANNILAVEYIRANKKLSAPLALHTVKREGCGYLDKTLQEGKLPSASALRAAVLSGIDCSGALPNAVRGSFLSAKAAGHFPCDGEKLAPAFLSSLLLNDPEDPENLLFCSGGLYYRLAAKAAEATSLTSLTELTATKKYTNARIRRAILACHFGITSSGFLSQPGYTQFLAANGTGLALLRNIREHTEFPILTKPSDTGALSAGALSEKTVADRADALFQYTKPRPASAASALRFSPFIMKNDDFC